MVPALKPKKPRNLFVCKFLDRLQAVVYIPLFKFLSVVAQEIMEQGYTG